MLKLATALTLLLCSSVSLAQSKVAVPAKTAAQNAASSDNSARLPVVRVVLYKNGVGYFEHMARVHGTQDLNIDFTSAQLNDVLKSLTAVDLGDGRITSVRYNSIAPLSERLRSLRLPFGEQITRSEFLNAMRGANVDVRSGATTASGRLLSVENTTRQDKNGNQTNVTLFSIITTSGEMKNFELNDATSVRIADHDLDEEIGRYLNLVGSARARDVRRMTLTASGAGDRDIFVSYISEVPVWKSTYRIILPDKPGDKPLLQGWAIVDNTIGEDWKDVQLSLVAGAPQSFIQDISQPYYARRPEVPLPQSVMLTPQTQEATVESGGEQMQLDAKLQAPPPAASLGIAGRAIGGLIGVSGPSGVLTGTVTDQSGAVVPDADVRAINTQDESVWNAITDQSGQFRISVPAGNYRITISAPGFRIYTATSYVGVGRSADVSATLNVGSVAETVTVETATSKLSPAAEGKSIGDFFEYNVKQKISINKNQSALVPVLQSHIEAEKVTLWSQSSDDDDDDSQNVPVRALWIKNTSGQVLDSGTFNILEGDTFAGEGIMDSIHPNERRLLSYAADPAVHIKTDQESSEKPYSRIKIAKGVMVLTREERQKTTYEIRDADKTPRTVVLEYPVEEDWELTKDTPKPEETSASFYRFRVPVDAGKTAQFTVEAVHPDESDYALRNIDSDEIALLVSQQRMTPDMQQAFTQILAQKNKVSALDEQITDRERQSKQISQDQARIRENMKALKGSSEERALIERYTGELNSQEDRLADLRKQTEDLRTQRAQANAELERMVMTVNLDESF